MKHKSALLLIAALICMAASAYADVVIVSPDNMGDWSIAVGNKGAGYFTNGGPAYAEIKAPNFPSGNGAFFGACTGAVQAPDSVWLGLDRFNNQPLAGTPLGAIWTMNYWSYVSLYPTVVGGGNVWKYPKQPFNLLLTITDGADYRTLMYRAWHDGQGQAPEGNNSITGKGVWQYQDCTQGMWYMFEGQVWDTWENIRNTYGSWTLTPTWTAYDPTTSQYMSPGWPNSTPVGSTWSTGTGKCINFEAGGRKTSEKIFLNATTAIQWYKEAAGFQGYVDKFTLGIDYGQYGSNVVEKTFDFEPAASKAPARTVLINQTAAYRLTERDAMRDGFAYKVWGWVTNADVDIVNGGVFEVMDGTTGLPVYIRALGHTAAIGDFIAARGTLRKTIWGTEPKNIYLWSSADNVDYLTRP